MDSAALGILASATVGMLSPYLAKIGDAVSNKAGEGIYDFVRSRFANRPVAQAALQGFKKDPQDIECQTTLVVQLQEVLKGDGEFADVLKGLLSEIQQEQAGSVSIEQRAGDNSKQFGQIIGNVSVGRD